MAGGNLGRSRKAEADGTGRCRVGISARAGAAGPRKRVKEALPGLGSGPMMYADVDSRSRLAASECVEAS